jgi:hypothetical protein
MTEAHGKYDTAAIMGGLYGAGIIGLKGAFDRLWAGKLHEDILQLFDEARAQGGLVARGPDRYYSEIHPERLRGFTDIIRHPWFVAVCKSVLGAEYKIVEVGYDMPGPGAQDQPWHRDFPSPEETRRGRRLNSLAFNITAVDCTRDLCPFEVAPGTQWDQWQGNQMFPPEQLYPRYAARGELKLPQMGDVSARTALMIHRGRKNWAAQSRPVLVVGVDAPDAKNSLRHDLQLSRPYYKNLTQAEARHFTCRVVDELQPIVQAHDIAELRAQ